jgi:hypothetical protein
MFPPEPVGYIMGRWHPEYQGQCIRALLDDLWPGQHLLSS